MNIMHPGPCNLLLILIISLFQINHTIAQSPATAGVCYATTGFGDGGRFFTINTQTGAASLVGDITGAAAVSGLSIDPKGNIYASDITDFEQTKLIRIDARTGAPTLIGNTGLNGLDALAFGPDGVLYGAETSQLDKFYKIDPKTATPTFIGFLGLTDPSKEIVGMAFDPTTGILYASAGKGDDGIYTINPGTGAASFVGNTGLGGSTPDIFFDKTGQLYGLKGGGGGYPPGEVPNYLISIDKYTGTGTMIGQLGYSTVSGAACYTPPPIPTISQWGLIVLGLGLLICVVVVLRQRIRTSNKGATSLFNAISDV